MNRLWCVSRVIIGIFIVVVLQAGGPAAWGADNGWQKVSWGGFTFSIPSEWVQVDTSNEPKWGLMDMENNRAIVFAIMKDRRHMDDQPVDEGSTQEKIGPTRLSGFPALAYYGEAPIPNGGTMKAKLICLDFTMPDGYYWAVMGMSVGLEYDKAEAVFDRIFETVKIDPAHFKE